MVNILIVGHDLKFINFYINHLEKSEHNVKIDHWVSHTAHDPKKSFELLDWADTIFCEWGLGNVVFYSNNKRSNQKLIVRLHRQELDTNYIYKANIDKIDLFITVSPYIYEEFARVFSLPRERMKLIYNQLDTERFYDKELSDRRYNLGIVGYLPKLKRLDLALDIFESLYEEDNRYKLFVKGKRPEELSWLMNIEDESAYYEQQFERIENAVWKENVIFEPYGEVIEFYNRMEFILSVSDVESFHLAVAEGMSCGAIPILNNWEGSNTIYNEKFILEYIEDIHEYVCRMRNDNDLRNEMREFTKKFDVDVVINQLNELVFSK